MRTPDDPTTAAFITNVRNHLKQRGISQEHLAGRIKVSRSLMSRRLSGKNPPSIEFAARCAAGLNVRLCELLEVA